MAKVLTFEEALENKRKLTGIVKKSRGKCFYIMHEKIINKPRNKSQVNLRELFAKGKGLCFLQPSFCYKFPPRYIDKLKQLVGEHLTVIVLPSHDYVRGKLNSWDPALAKTKKESWECLTRFMKRIKIKEVCIGGFRATVSKIGTRLYELGRPSRLKKKDAKEIKNKPWLRGRPRLTGVCVKLLEKNLVKRGINVTYARGYFHPDLLKGRREFAHYESPESEQWTEQIMRRRGKRRYK